MSNLALYQGGIRMLKEVLSEMPEEDTPIKPDFCEGPIAIPNPQSRAIASLCPPLSLIV
jgi:hypothetical protein